MTECPVVFPKPGTAYEFITFGTIGGGQQTITKEFIVLLQWDGKSFFPKRIGKYLPKRHD